MGKEYVIYWDDKTKGTIALMLSPWVFVGCWWLKTKLDQRKTRNAAK